MNDSKLPMSKPKLPKESKEAGKLGLALLMWFLGVPGFIIVLYLIFGR